MSDGPIFHETMAAFSWKNCYWNGAVAALAYERNKIWQDDFKSAFGVKSVELVAPGSEFEVNLVFLHFDDITYCGIEGTTSKDQIISYTLLDFPRQHLEPSWIFPQHFFTLGNHAGLSILARVPPGKPVVISGHSLGGAAATIAGEIVRRNGRPVTAVWTYGSPRPGNVAFAEAYTVPNHRMFSALDIVARVAPSWDYVIRGGHGYDPFTTVLYHVGEEHPITGTDPFESVYETLANIKTFGAYGVWSHVAHHFLGSYMEGIYSHLSPSERDQLSVIYSTLVPRGSHGTSSTPPAGFNVEAPPGEVTAATVGEEETLRSFVGPDGAALVHLFTGPRDLPADLSTASFMEPSFPGYEAQPIPEDVSISTDGYGASQTRWVGVEFTPSADLPAPQEIAGAYLSVANSDGERKPFKATLFPVVAKIQKAEQPLKVLVRLTCTEVLK